MTTYFERGDLVSFPPMDLVTRRGRILSLDTVAQTFDIRCLDSTVATVNVLQVAKVLPPLALPKTKR